MKKLINCNALATIFVCFLHHHRTVVEGNHQLLGGGCTAAIAPFQGIGDISNCLFQNSSNNNNALLMELCCGALNQAIQTGFYCLCSLLVTAASSSSSASNAVIKSSSSPILTNFLLSNVAISGCHISVPSLALCRELGPMPIVIPPEKSAEETPPPSYLSDPPSQLEWAYLPNNVSSTKPINSSELKPHLNTSSTTSPTAGAGLDKSKHDQSSAHGPRPNQILLCLSWLAILFTCYAVLSAKLS